MTAPTIVFDLDGTLVDTAPDLVDTLNAILREHDVPPVAFDDARTMIGAGVKPLLQRAIASKGLRFAPHQIDTLYEAYLQLYAVHIADRSRPFPGLTGALDTLAAQGCRLAVCTNKLEWLSRRLLDALDLTRRFAFICGQDTFGVKKPDPSVLKLTIERAGGDIADAVMVGDSVTDIETARAAGIPVIAVDFGYTEIPVARLNPDLIICGFDALPAAIAALRRKDGVALTAN